VRISTVNNTKSEISETTDPLPNTVCPQGEGYQLMPFGLKYGEKKFSFKCLRKRRKREDVWTIHVKMTIYFLRRKTTCKSKKVA
jgi:hypothetical protein